MTDGQEKNIEIHTEHIRLDALIKYAGIAETGGAAKTFIKGGEVRVNGEACRQRGKKIYPGDRVECGDLAILVGKRQ
jgi:ribosome-associated protein